MRRTLTALAVTALLVIPTSACETNQPTHAVVCAPAGQIIDDDVCEAVGIGWLYVPWSTWQAQSRYRGELAPAGSRSEPSTARLRFVDPDSRDAKTHRARRNSEAQRDRSLTSRVPVQRPVQRPAQPARPRTVTR